MNDVKNYQYLFFIFLWHFFIFFYALTSDFLVHDEYRFFTPLAGLHWPHCCAVEVLADHYRSTGRFISAEIIRIVSKLPITEISHLKYLRIFAVIVLASSNFILFLILKNSINNNITNLLVSIILFSLLGFLSGVLWLPASIQYFSLFVSLLSVLLFYKNFQSSNFFLKNIYIIFILSSILIYPAGSSIVFVPFVIVLLFSKPNEIKLNIYKIGIYVKFYVITFAAFFIIQKFFIIPVLTFYQIGPPPNSDAMSFAIGTDPTQILRVIYPLLYRSLNFWNPYTNIFVPGIILYFVMLFVCVQIYKNKNTLIQSIKYLFSQLFKKQKKMNSVNYYLIAIPSLKLTIKKFISFIFENKYGLLILIYFLGNIHLLLPEGGVYQHRTRIFNDCFMLIILVWFLLNIIENKKLKSFLKEKSNVLLLTTTVLITINNYSLVYKHVDNLVKEKIFVDLHLEEIFKEKNYKKIYIKSPIATNPHASIETYNGEKLYPAGYYFMWLEFFYVSIREEWPAYVVSKISELGLNFKVCDANHQPDLCTHADVWVGYDGMVGQSKLIKHPLSPKEWRIIDVGKIND